jgi:hypothetical protein
MHYIICPTCGELMGNKEKLYHEGKKKICKKYGIDDDFVSLERYRDDKDFQQEMIDLLDGLVNKDSICCAARLPNIIDLCKLIKS